MNKLQLLKAVSDCCDRAFDLTGIKLSDHGVIIKLERHMGRTAGQFRWKRRDLSPELRFSIPAALANPKDMLEDTIPHEVAHAIVYFKYAPLGRITWNRHKGHSPTWRRLCIDLGGTGKVYHTLELKPRHAQRRWVYVASCGTRVELTTTMHTKVQQGQTRRLRNGGGIIAKEHFRGPAS